MYLKHVLPERGYDSQATTESLQLAAVRVLTTGRAGDHSGLQTVLHPEESRDAGPEGVR